MTLEIPTQLEAALQSKASAQGLSPESYALSVLERETKPASNIHADWSKFAEIAASLPHYSGEFPVSEKEATTWLDEARGERETTVWDATFGHKGESTDEKHER